LHDVRALRAERDLRGLADALRDPDPDVVRAASRASVLEALGRIGDRRGVGPVLDALDDGRAEARVAALEALGAIGDPRTLDALRRFLERHDLDAEERMLAEDAIVDIERLAGRGRR
jgi:HEAT repeat protein